MNRLKRITVCCIAASLAIVPLAACGGKDAARGGSEVKLAENGVYPISCDDTLTYWMDLDTRLEGTYSNFGETPLAKALEEETGVKVEYIHPQAGQASEQFNIMLASDELPDMVRYNWAGYSGGPGKAISDKYIYDLSDVIKDYAPALSKYLSENPDTDKKIKTDDGEYFAFPFVRGEKWMTSTQGLILRSDWLDKLGMDVPKTMDELEEVLRGFKKLGASAPLVLSTAQLQMFFYAYGCVPGYYVDNGEVKYGYTEAGAKKAIEKMAQWYKEGLLDNNLVSVDTKYIQSRMLNEDAGACFGYVASGIGTMLSAKPNDEFDLVAVRQPTEDGSRPEYAYAEDRVLANSAVAITTNCPNTELAARFLDYGYTDEGHMLYNFGIEGESYNMVDGKPVMSELITNNPEGLSFAQAAVRYSQGSSSGIFVQDPEYVLQSLTYRDVQENAYEVWADNNMEEHMLPAVTMLADEQDEYTEIISNVSTYVSEQYIKFVTGQESLDSYDEYIKQIEDYDIDRATELMQSAYERYEKR